MTTDTTARVSGTIIPLEWSSSDNPWRRCEAFCPIVRFTFVIWSDCTDVDAEKARIEADRADRIAAAIQPDPEPKPTPEIATVSVEAVKAAISEGAHRVFKHRSYGYLVGKHGFNRYEDALEYAALMALEEKERDKND